MQADKNLHEKLYIGWEKYYQQSMNRPAWQEEADRLVQVFMQHLGYTGNSQIHVADYGCGDGRNLWPWLKVGATVTAVDLAPSALNKIARYCIESSVICPTLVCSEMENLPLAEGQFDVSQCLDALPQVYNVSQALKQIALTLRPNGKMLFNVFTPKDCAFGEGEQVEEKAFLYKQTLFRFFDHEDIMKILPTELEIVQAEHERWDDPPHIPFRPYPHTHDGIYYICRKK